MLLHSAFLVMTMIFIAVPEETFLPEPHSISGRVVDAGGLPLPSVEVTLEQSNDEWKRSCTTDKDGMYYFDCLSEGDYSISFRSRGFITERMENFTYNRLGSLTLNRTLELDHDRYADIIFRVPSDEPGKPLIIIVKDNRSSDYLEHAQVVISDANGILPKSATTNLCGNTSVHLVPGKSYSARISKNGFQEEVINFDMTDEPKRLEVRLKPIG